MQRCSRRGPPEVSLLRRLFIRTTCLPAGQSRSRSDFTTRRDGSIVVQVSDRGCCFPSNRRQHNCRPVGARHCCSSKDRCLLVGAVQGSLKFVSTPGYRARHTPVYGEAVSSIRRSHPRASNTQRATRGASPRPLGGAARSEGGVQRAMILWAWVWYLP